MQNITLSTFYRGSKTIPMEYSLDEVTTVTETETEV